MHMTEAERGHGAVEFVPDGGELQQQFDELRQQVQQLQQRVCDLETYIAQHCPAADGR